MSVTTYVRCEACGDSLKHPWKKHRAVYPDGSSYCHRCGDCKRVSFETLVQMALDETVPIDLDDDWITVFHDRTLSDRFTMLQPYKTDGMESYVSFQMRSASGQLLGWHHRHTSEKRCLNEGQRGLGYVGSSLRSSPSSPIIAVEGPFDVISDRHVCTFGLVQNLKSFRLQYVWLQPDPDQLMTQSSRALFWHKVIKRAVNDYMVFVQGVIVGNGDPDEATVIKHFTLDQGKEFIG